MTAHRRVIEDRADEAAELRRRVDERRADRWFRLERQYNGPIPAPLRAWALAIARGASQEQPTP